VPDSEENLVDAGGVAEILGLAHRHSVSTYRSRYADFPRPVRRSGRLLLWSAEEIVHWQRDRVRRGTQRRAADPHARQEALVQAVVRLMLANPGEDLGIRAIAAEAGIAHSDVYRYADSKQQLLDSAVDRLVSTYRASMPATLEELEDQLGAFVAAAMRRRAGMRVVAAEVIRDPRAPIREPLVLGTLAELIAEHRERTGATSDFPPEVLAAGIGSLLWGWALFEGRWRGGLNLGDSDEAEAWMTEVVRRLLHA
jgi:AcrR family transcriptional regulator